MSHKHIRYRDSADFIDGTERWGQSTFEPTLKPPTLYVVDQSFDFEAFGIKGTHNEQEIDVIEQVRSGAKIAYTIHHAPLRSKAPIMPPRELEFPYVWHNAPMNDEEHIPSLPNQVDLWCHLELHTFEARIIGGALLVLAEYTYQYSFDPVLADS